MSLGGGGGGGEYVEIWRNMHANNVLVVLHDVFSDFYLDTANIELMVEDENDIIDCDWLDIRDDSVITDSGLYQNADTTAEDADLLQNSVLYLKQLQLNL